ncbi:hypothetical protein PACTADRAFT_49743 [Pachysolen tannophilus NRRL Y-2460]|uniref:SEC7 domain-containing protein n=1 Tax=Pachysolen tannophilus NRRL Y-2460 TaxID=669874 RepID=A0A1E4TXC9_PACTA|nr:hypothetical protein PACTADRAFT_49743 [Pachysolen tannophilus NRRL Y-2460]
MSDENVLDSYEFEDGFKQHQQQKQKAQGVGVGVGFGSGHGYVQGSNLQEGEGVIEGEDQGEDQRWDMDKTMTEMDDDLKLDYSILPFPLVEFLQDERSRVKFPAIALLTNTRLSQLRLRAFKMYQIKYYEINYKGYLHYLCSINDLDTTIIRHFYMSFFKWSPSLVTSLRSLCKHLFFKGESQDINVILESFSDYWYDYFKNDETILFGNNNVGAYLISYSLIILNTDLHSFGGDPKIKKITKNEFVKNNLQALSSNGIKVNSLRLEHELKNYYDDILYNELKLYNLNLKRNYNIKQPTRSSLLLKRSSAILQKNPSKKPSSPKTPTPPASSASSTRIGSNSSNFSTNTSRSVGFTNALQNDRNYNQQLLYNSYNHAHNHSHNHSHSHSNSNSHSRTHSHSQSHSHSHNASVSASVTASISASQTASQTASQNHGIGHSRKISSKDSVSSIHTQNNIPTTRGSSSIGTSPSENDNSANTADTSIATTVPLNENHHSNHHYGKEHDEMEEEEEEEELHENAQEREQEIEVDDNDTDDMDVDDEDDDDVEQQHQQEVERFYCPGEEEGDLELELEGPPWVKEGLLNVILVDLEPEPQNSYQATTNGNNNNSSSSISSNSNGLFGMFKSNKAKPVDNFIFKNKWKNAFVVVSKGELSIFSFDKKKNSKNKVSSSYNLKNDDNRVVGAGNWYDTAEFLGSFNLSSCLAEEFTDPQLRSFLIKYHDPKRNLNKESGLSHGSYWCLRLPTSEEQADEEEEEEQSLQNVYYNKKLIFQAGTVEITREFIDSCNFWSSRTTFFKHIDEYEPLSSMEYGWSKNFISYLSSSTVKQDGELIKQLSNAKIFKWTSFATTLVYQKNDLKMNDQFNRLFTIVESLQYKLSEHKNLKPILVVLGNTIRFIQESFNNQHNASGNSFLKRFRGGSSSSWSSSSSSSSSGTNQENVAKMVSNYKLIILNWNNRLIFLQKELRRHKMYLAILKKAIELRIEKFKNKRIDNQIPVKKTEKELNEDMTNLNVNELQEERDEEVLENTKRTKNGLKLNPKIILVGDPTYVAAN